MTTALLSRRYESELLIEVLLAAGFVFIAFVFVACATLTVRTPLGLFDASSLLPLLSLVPVFVYIVLNQAIRLRRLKFDMRRSATVVSGSLAAPLAEVQPQAQTPDLPLDIRLRQHWVGFFIAITASGLLVDLLSHILQPIIGFPASTSVILTFSACWLFPMLFQPPYPETQRIVVTEEGMKVNDISTIAWSDARLFALIGPRRRNPSVIFYEVADTEEALVFRVRTKPFPWYSWLAPDIPFPEYQAQTQQLLGFIAAKTGLPLRAFRN